MILAALASLVIMAQAPVILDQAPRDFGDQCVMVRYAYVEVTSGGDLKVWREPTPQSQLRTRLLDVLAKVPTGCDHMVYLVAKADVPYDRVVEAFRRLRSLGFDEVGLMRLEEDLP